MSDWYSTWVDTYGAVYRCEFKTAEEAHRSYVHATDMASTTFAQYGNKKRTHSASWSPQ